MSDLQAFQDRRLQFADLLPGIPGLFASGCPRLRNYPAHSYPFRASSHYLFFGAPNEPNQLLMVLNGEATLYRAKLDCDDAVWHGPSKSDEQVAEEFGFQAIKSLEELEADLSTLGIEEVLSLPSPDVATNEVLRKYLGRVPNLDEDPDIDLVDTMMELRRCSDSRAQEHLRKAVEATITLQKTVIGKCKPGISEAELRGHLDLELAKNGWTASFQPIISVSGEVLHNPHYSGTLADGDLLLVDCGAELKSGWAGDLTRTVPVNGSFSATQKALYDIVDKARATAIEMAAPGVHFRDMHLASARVIAEGLVELGIFKGEVNELVERGAHALFFPHGLGHLVGLDVHDMEDFGDRIGYEEGEERSDQFGLSYLRLCRELEVGMVVTIEPGFYQIPALLEGALAEQFSDVLDKDVLAKYADVRGIRIEDEILITESGHEILSQALPTNSAEVEKLVGTGQ